MSNPSQLSIYLGLNRLVIAFFSIVLVSAQLSADSILIRDLEYSLVEYKSSDAWYELSIELEVFRDGDDKLRRDEDFLDDIDVELVVGFEVKSPERAYPFEFYRAETRLASIKVGAGEIRFYLPPEIVDRDRLRGAPHSHLIRISRKGELLHQSVAPSLSRESVLQNFEIRVSEYAPLNDGVLVGQQNTPFASEYSGSTINSKSDHSSKSLRK